MKRPTLPPIRLIGVMALILALLLPAQAHALFGSITPADEIEMGRKFDEEVRKQMPVVDDPEVKLYVKSVVDRVAATLPPQPYPIRSAVIANNSMNAFAIPGGYIYIFTGLILNVDNEDELAAVIGHELGHVTQHHIARRMEQMKYISIASLTGLVAGALLGAGGGSNMANAGQALALGSVAGGQSAFLMYTRENENEADNVGLNYLIRAGYNPNAMPQTFEIMNRQRWFMSGDNIPSYLSTHPGITERIDYLRERLRHLPADVLRRDFEHDKFVRIQTILRARLSSAETALAYYNNKPKDKQTCMDKVGRGIALDRLKRQQQAAQAFSEALACGANDALVLREAGIFYFNQGDMNRAAPLLQKAAFLNPRDAMSMFFTARIMGEQRKDYAGAISLMKRVMQMVPEDAEVRFHLGRLMGESGDLFGAHLQLSYSFHYGRDNQKAKFHLEKAKTLAASPEQKKELEQLERTLGGGKGPGGKDGKDGKDGKGGDGKGGGAPSFQMRFGPARLAQ